MSSLSTSAGAFLSPIEIQAAVPNSQSPSFFFHCSFPSLLFPYTPSLRLFIIALLSLFFPVSFTPHTSALSFLIASSPKSRCVF